MTNATVKQVEAAGIVSLFIVGMTAVVAVAARRFGLKLGVSHDVRGGDAAKEDDRAAAALPRPQQPTGS